MPMSISNIETNPSYVASENSMFLTSVSHLNNFQETGRFSMNNLKISKYFENYFSGIGLNFSNTNISDSIKYNHIGLSFAYRNILFNKVYVKFGIHYKLIGISAPQGNFTKYNFIAESNIVEKTNTQNLNLSLTFSSPLEEYYATVGFLNITPIWAKETNYFPQYNYIRIGNFWKLIRSSSDNEISFLIYSQRYNFDIPTTSYYMTIYKQFIISRLSRFKIGGDIGYNSFHKFILKPSFIFFKVRRFNYNSIRNQQSNIIMFKLSADFELKMKSYKPVYIFSILYNIK